uniref:Bm13483, isoform c n=1 Tax=Brugia malayi TaxID=6279 RepID=A0A1I9G2Y5_BRUMA|nr:Bm13483, isoform c [Brugia malayi]
MKTFSVSSYSELLLAGCIYQIILENLKISWFQSMRKIWRELSSSSIRMY